MHASRLVDSSRDIHRVGALGGEKEQRFLMQYSRAINQGAPEDVRHASVAVAHSLLAGHLDNDGATMWMLGFADLVMISWLGYLVVQQLVHPRVLQFSGN